MRIHIENLRFETIIGILEHERVSPQSVIINLTIDYEYKDEFINYALVSENIESLMKEKKFLLIEEALVSLSKDLKEKFPLIKKLFLKITKPSIMPNSEVSVSDTYLF